MSLSFDKEWHRFHKTEAEAVMMGSANCLSAFPDSYPNL